MNTPSKQALQMHELLMQLGRHRTLRDPLAMLSEDLALTAPQTHALLWLGEETSLTMGALARRSGITEKSMTGIVDRLEAMEVAERVRSVEDRRAVSVVLTAKGKGIYAELASHVNQGLEQMLELLGPEDHLLLVGIIERLLEKMKARSALTEAVPAP